MRVSYKGMIEYISSQYDMLKYLAVLMLIFGCADPGRERRDRGDPVGGGGEYAGRVC